jgi:hypothetical protein
MTDWLDIGSSPPAEPCAQVGSDDYYPHARRECRTYIHQLRRVLGNEPTGARLAIRTNPHDFGDYLWVACYFDPNKQAAVEYAYRCESDGPEEWDEEAIRELDQQKGTNHG